MRAVKCTERSASQPFQIYIVVWSMATELQSCHVKTLNDQHFITLSHLSHFMTVIYYRPNLKRHFPLYSAKNDVMNYYVS